MVYAPIAMKHRIWLDMAIIKTHLICDCGTHMVKDTTSNGDFYPTHIGVVHQSFCPNDGKMLPLVRERDPQYISNNSKKKILNRIAVVHHLRFKTLMKIYYRCLKQIDDKSMFINRLIDETSLSTNQVLSLSELN